MFRSLTTWFYYRLENTDPSGWMDIVKEHDLTIEEVKFVRKQFEGHPFGNLKHPSEVTA